MRWVKPGHVRPRGDETREMPKQTKQRTPSGSARGARTRGSGGQRLAAAFELVERMPALAESRERLLRLTAKQGADEDEIVEAVEAEPALAIAVLRAANTRAGSGRGGLSGVPQAVEILGPKGVERATSRLETYEFFERGNGWRGLPDRFRRHATATRRAVERVGEVARLPGRDELAVAALLHDIGKLVMARLYRSYDELVGDPSVTPETRARKELRELGVDHALVGGVLARRWGLPQQVARAIERHHSVEAEGSAAAVRLADLIVNHAHGAAVSPEAVEASATRLGIDQVKLRALLYEYPYSRPDRRRRSVPCPLSAREIDALRGLAGGKVYKEIAEEMSLSASTVRTHLHNVYRKIGAVDRAQAVLLARDRGWI
jgi:putative nucleotidyltransferase with HDIG domain